MFPSCLPVQTLSSARDPRWDTNYRLPLFGLLHSSPSLRFSLEQNRWIRASGWFLGVKSTEQDSRHKKVTVNLFRCQFSGPENDLERVRVNFHKLESQVFLYLDNLCIRVKHCLPFLSYDLVIILFIPVQGRIKFLQYDLTGWQML